MLPDPHNQDDSRLARMSREGTKAKQALVKTWPYVVVGIIIGSGLLTLGEYLPRIIYPYVVPDLIKKLIEHLGVGFLVAAIAVFFYEWGSHAKEMRETNKRLLEWENALPSENLGKSIRKLFGERDDTPLPVQASSLAVHCGNLVMHIASLLGQRETWANSQYLDFLLNFVSKYVVSNSEAFSLLGTQKGERRIVMPPTAPQSASDLLERYVASLDAGDSYQVVANMTAWRNNQLSDFHKVANNAIGKGVIIHRVFNFTDDYGVKLNIDEVIDVSRQHLEDAERSASRYQVRILGNDELSKSTSRMLTTRTHQLHFAVVTHDDQQVRLKFEGQDLSEILLTRDESAINANKDLFDEAYGHAVELNRENWNGIITRLAQQLNQAVPAGALLETAPPKRKGEEKKL
jgi:hypothetical protein